MQDRYVADIGDYGKYGLLKFICNNCNKPKLRLGVNWYLVKPEELGEDNNSDGKKINYLYKEKQFRKYDEDLFDELKNIVTSDKRTVYEVKKRHILPEQTIFYAKLLSYRDKKNTEARKTARDSWLEESLQRLKECDIVFFDPDNGIKPPKTKEYRKRGIKYVFKEEIEKYYYLGKSLIIYNHRSMEPEKKYQERFNFIKNLTKHDNTPCLRFHKGGTRDYIFVLRRENRSRIEKVLSEFLETVWNECFRRLKL